MFYAFVLMKKNSLYICKIHKLVGQKVLKKLELKNCTIILYNSNMFDFLQVCSQGAINFSHDLVFQ